VSVRLPDAERAAGTRNLSDSIASGDWDRRYGYLREMTEFDAGYRLVICGV